MFTHIITLTRPNTSVEWYTPDPSYKEYLQNNYIDLGIIVSRTSTESPDGLSKTIRTSFIEKPAYYSMFIIDPVIQEFSVLTTEYYLRNGINLSVTIETDEVHP